MAQVAKATRDDLGWEVSGSDEPFGPPATTYLEENHLLWKTPYAAANVPAKVDLVVTGGGALASGRENPEYQRAQELGLKIVSYPQLVEKYLIKKNSIVVAGTYGKTTITALIAWILQQAGLNPSYLVGGFPLNFPDGVKFTDSDYSVVEGDEHPTLNFDPRPKFAWYHPTHLLLTSALWDHFNVYQSEAAYIQVFKDLVASLPADGQLVASAQGENLEQVLPAALCPVTTYSLEAGGDWSVRELKFGEARTTLKAFKDGQEGLALETSLLGEFNVANILGAAALCSALEVEPLIIKRAVATFAGVKERLEVLGQVGGVTLIRDFAHSPVKIKASIEALRTRYPQGKKPLTVVLDLHSSVLRDRQSLPALAEALAGVERVCLTKIRRFQKDPLEKGVLAKDLLETFKKVGLEVFYCPKSEQLAERVRQKVKRGEVLVFMSSGGLEEEVAAVKAVLREV